MKSRSSSLTEPISNVDLRSPREVFDIMCARINARQEMSRVKRALSKGSDPQRKRLPGHKYDAAVVAEIRKLCAEGRTQKSLAQQFGIPRSSVQRICADVEKPYEHRGRKGSKREVHHHGNE